MNELIQKLAEDAGLDARTMGVSHTEQWMTKLAELIVKACGDFTDPVTRNLMMKYFGVEE